MICYFCSGASPKEHEAVYLQKGELFPDANPQSQGSVFYPVCNAHKVETGIYPDERTIPIPGLGSTADDLHRALDFIRHYFSTHPLPGMEGEGGYPVKLLCDERLSVLIRVAHCIQKAKLELYNFVSENPVDE